MGYRVSSLGDEHLAIVDTQTPWEDRSGGDNPSRTHLLRHPELARPRRVGLVQPVHAVGRSWHTVHRLPQMARTLIVAGISPADLPLIPLEDHRVPDRAVVNERVRLHLLASISEISPRAICGSAATRTRV